MSTELEQRVAALEKLVEPYAVRQADIANTERKILDIVRQIARVKCARYYVNDQGQRCLCNAADELPGFQFSLDIEISKLGVDLMGTDRS